VATNSLKFSTVILFTCAAFLLTSCAGGEVEQLNQVSAATGPSQEDSPEQTRQKQLDDPSDTDSTQELEDEKNIDSNKISQDLFDALDGAGGFTWMQIGEPCPSDSACPVLIAAPEDVLSDSSQGCVVTAYDPEDYDLESRSEELENLILDMPGEAIWINEFEGLAVELRATSAESECWQPSKSRMGWPEELDPQFIGPAAQSTQPQEEQTILVSMPNLVGATEKDAKSWLKNNGFKFNVYADWGFNPKTSRCIGGQGVVLSQSPTAGTQVRNETSTRLTIRVDCDW